jgi:hypothetical protein
LVSLNSKISYATPTCRHRPLVDIINPGCFWVLRFLIEILDESAMCGVICGVRV